MQDYFKKDILKMKYFNGFSLKNEEALFDDILVNDRSCVAGFSYGAQQAFEYVYKSKQRIDKLILLSPAFFQTQKNSFVRIQVRYFKSDKEAYVKQFLENVSYPSKVALQPYVNIGSKKDLEALLTYVWDKDKLKEIQNRGTVVEVFFGDKDKIIDAKEAFGFFSPLTKSYFFKDRGHLLTQRSKS